MQTALFWGAVTACLLSIAVFVITVQQCRRAVLDCRAALASIRKYAELHSDVVDLAERVDGTEKSLKRLHSRAGMREVRERRGADAATSSPRWDVDPKAFIAAHSKPLVPPRSEP